MLTEEQRLARKTGLGGSDIAAVLGVNAYKTANVYKTAFDVYMEKVHDKQQYFSDDQLLRMQLGNHNEGFIRDLYCAKNNVHVIEPSDTIRHPDYEFMLANVDGLIDNGINPRPVLEIKYSNAYHGEWGDEATCEIPRMYLCQVAHYCFVTDAPYADIAVL